MKTLLLAIANAALVAAITPSPSPQVVSKRSFASQALVHVFCAFCLAGLPIRPHAVEPQRGVIQPGLLCGQQSRLPHR
jgi:hypothetical protein